MDKRLQRTEAKRESILQVATALFSAHGMARVSVDEIAAQAGVSKVTIYKYFSSKDALYASVVNRAMNDSYDATVRVFDSDMDYLEKLKFILQTQSNLTQLVSYPYLFQVWEKNSDIAATMNETLDKVRQQMQKFLEEGKANGFIEESLSIEMLYLYAEIFRAGLRAKSIDLDSVLADKSAVEALLDLYFFGIIRRPPAREQPE